MAQLSENADKLIMGAGDVVIMREPPNCLWEVEIVRREVDENMVRFRVKVMKVIRKMEGVRGYNVGDEFDIDVCADRFSMGMGRNGSLVNSAMNGELWTMTRPPQAQTEAEA